MSQEWYSKSLEVLNPLRFHLYELINRAEQINFLQSQLGKPALFPTHQLERAANALDEAEKHFQRKQ